MKVLVLGSGGREHALVWKLRASQRVTKLYCAPGNGGMEDDAECAAVDLRSLQSMVALAERVENFWADAGSGTAGIEQEFCQTVHAAASDSDRALRHLRLSGRSS